MTPQYTTQREGVGRRQADQECAAHEERLDAMERKLSWQKGAMYVVSGFLAITLPVFGWLANATYSKVSNIEVTLNRGEIASSILATKIESHDARLRAIEERHVYESQARK